MFNCQKVRISEAWIHGAAPADTTCEILEKSTLCLSFLQLKNRIRIIKGGKDLQDHQV